MTGDADGKSLTGNTYEIKPYELKPGVERAVLCIISTTVRINVCILYGKGARGIQAIRTNRTRKKVILLAVHG